VGRVGGALGMIGAGWSLIGVRDEELAGGAEVVVDGVGWEAKSDSELCTWGSGLRLWTVQLDSLPHSRHENSDCGRSDS